MSMIVNENGTKALEESRFKPAFLDQSVSDMIATLELENRLIREKNEHLESELEKARSAEPAAWFVMRNSPGKRDHGMKLGPFWKRTDAERWLDENHTLHEMFFTHQIQQVPAAEITLQEVWTAVGGNPDINPSKQQVINALRMRHQDPEEFESIKSVRPVGQVRQVHGEPRVYWARDMRDGEFFYTHPPAQAVMKIKQALTDLLKAVQRCHCENSGTAQDGAIEALNEAKEHGL